MRIFISIDIPEKLKEKIKDLQKKLKDFDIKFVEKENLHFCLKFLGETEEGNVEKIKKLLSKICEKFEPFEINISGLGAFPSKNYVRVIWLGVKQGYQETLALAEEINNSLPEFKEERKFEPHLTLGRVRSGRNKNELSMLLKKLENIEIGTFEVNEIKIIESKLTPKGPIYEEIFSALLR